MRSLDKGSLVSALIVAGLAISSLIFKSEAMLLLKRVLEHGYLSNLLILSIFVIVITHAIKIRPNNDQAGVYIRSGFMPLDIFLTLGTYTAVAKTACSLLKGAFIQKFFKTIYFTKFSELDVYTLLGVSSLLIWYVVFHMYKLSVELFFPLEVPELSTENMHNKSLNSDRVTAIPSQAFWGPK